MGLFSGHFITWYYLHHNAHQHRLTQWEIAFLCFDWLALVICISIWFRFWTTWSNWLASGTCCLVSRHQTVKIQTHAAYVFDFMRIIQHFYVEIRWTEAHLCRGNSIRLISRSISSIHWMFWHPSNWIHDPWETTISLLILRKRHCKRLHKTS